MMPTQHNVPLGDPLSLVCGRGLDSNPQATITWTAPDGTIITNDDRYTLENGSEIVRLNITRVISNDSGIWSCEIIVTSEKHVDRNGTLVLGEQTVIGAPIQHQFMVTLLVGELRSIHDVENKLLFNTIATYLQLVLLRQLLPSLGIAVLLLVSQLA
jgi:hypothetical protein